jgi:hypothetical protein
MQRNPALRALCRLLSAVLLRVAACLYLASRLVNHPNEQGAVEEGACGGLLLGSQLFGPKLRAGAAYRDFRAALPVSLLVV